MSAGSLNALLRVTTDVDAKTALKAFLRKWMSDWWSWSLDANENDICLTRFIDEAEVVLARRKDAHQSGAMSSASASITPTPPAGQTTPLPNGDVFRPHLPDLQRMTEDLHVNAATSLAILKAAVVPLDPQAHDESNVDNGSRSSSPGSGRSLRPVALLSMNGEGGVGKTCTCKLLCGDVEVRRRFGKGAILWIDVGKGATEESLKEELGSEARRCGGERSQELIRSSRGLKCSESCANILCWASGFIYS